MILLSNRKHLLPFSRAQYRQKQCEAVLQHKRQVTRNVSEHECDDHRHEYPQKQQFLFHGHDAPPSRAAVAREQHPGRLFRARPDGNSPYADLFGSVGGTGFGTVFSGTLRSLLPYAQPGERAGLLSAYFVEGYLSFSLPALAAGFLAPIVGLTRTTDYYGIGVILLAITSLAITLLQGRRA